MIHNNIINSFDVQVFKNGEWNTFKPIGEFNVLSITEIDYMFPDKINEKNSWGTLNKVINPINLLFHIREIENDSAILKENYGVQFAYNYIKSKDLVNEIYYMFIDKQVDYLNEDNFLIVSPGESINFLDYFNWSENNEWARSDSTNEIILFDESPSTNCAFINIKIYDDFVNKVNLLWEQLIH